LSENERTGYAGNAIALAHDSVWMSATAERSLSDTTKARLAKAGFAIRSVDLDAIEAAGGSLRCCVGELF
jgi:hypothetical protein